MDINFSTFANLLYPVYADMTDVTQFTRTLLNKIANFDEAYNPIDELSDETIKAYWTGRLKLKGLAPKMVQHIDVNRFANYLDESNPNNDAYKHLIKKIEPFVGELAGDMDIAELFRDIILDAASGKREKRTKNTMPTEDLPLQSIQNVSFRKLRIAPFSQMNFVPRPELIATLREAHNKNRLVFIRGLAGVGKSELARHYAQVGEFETILPMELNVDGSGSWKQLISDLELSGASLADEKSLAAKKRDLLENAGPETLIILDNFNSPDGDSLIRPLIQETGNARVLITSQLGAEALVEICACEIIDLEQINSGEEAEFCTKLFCSYAGITTPDASVLELCSMIGNHPLTATLLGIQLRKNRKFGDTIDTLLHGLRTSMRKALSNEDSLRIRLGQKRDDLLGTPYDILRNIFCNVLAIDFFVPAKRRHRQVLAAIILLPREFHHTEQIVEMVGDIDHCREARNAVIWLEEAGILQVDSENRLVLHPLLHSLFSDPSLSTDGSTIAELSIPFLFHLSRNAFVSQNEALAKMPNTFAFGGNARCGIDLSKLEDDFDCSWAIRWNPLEGYSENDLQRIERAINSNHESLNLDERITTTELRELLVPAPPNYDLKRNGLFFCIEHKTGRSLWLSDYATKKNWCILNCSQQRETAFRYYDGAVTRNQNGTVVNAEFDGFTWGQAPSILCFPQTVCGATLTKIKNALGNKGMEFVCFPPSIQEVEDKAFKNSPQLLCAVFTGESGVIGEGAFLGCPELMVAILPRKPAFIGRLAFSQCPRLKSVAVSVGTNSEVHNADAFLFAAADITDDSGLYHQGEYAYKMCELLLASEDEEFLDITGTRPVDYVQFMLDTLSAKPTWELREFRFGTDVVVDSNGYLAATPDYLKDSWSVSEEHANLEFPFDKTCKITFYEKQPIPADGEPIGWKDVWAFLKLCNRNFSKEIEIGNNKAAGEYAEMAQYILTYRREFFTEKQREQWSSLFKQTY